MLYVFSGVSKLTGEFLEICSSFLPSWRLDQLMRYRFPVDRKLNALGYLLLVYALKNEGYFHSLPEFGFHIDGKPFLVNYPGVYFNLSHCHQAVVCILCCREAGVDVEAVCAYDDDLAKAISNDAEYSWINESPNPEAMARRFTELWTRKESLLKWRGTGLTNDLRNILSEALPDVPGCGYHISTHYDHQGQFYISTCTTH
jgi:4'-phosphopantetheinyl transferase